MLIRTALPANLRPFDKMFRNKPFIHSNSCKQPSHINANILMTVSILFEIATESTLREILKR